MNVHCSYLEGEVELSSERERHIRERHPDLLAEHREAIIRTLADPDEVRKSARMEGARLFSRWFADVRGGKHVVVVVVTEHGPHRHWVVTAYIARRITGGTTEWTRS